MKNHALHHLKKTQEYHEAMAKVHRDAAAEHAKLVDKATADDVHHNLSSLHKLAQEQHDTMASHCEAMQKAIRQYDAVDTSVPTNANSFGGHQFSAAQLADELTKRWGMRPGVEATPSGLSAVAPSEASAQKTGDRKNRLIGRDGKDPRDEGLEKSPPKDAVPSLAHWFD
jgi:hypothetical protein